MTLLILDPIPVLGYPRLTLRKEEHTETASQVRPESQFTDAHIEKGKKQEADENDCRQGPGIDGGTTTTNVSFRVFLGSRRHLLQ